MVELVRVVSRLDRLDDAIRSDGVLTKEGKAHPALVEARQQQIVMSRLLATLRLPEDWDLAEGSRPQRRGSARGAYGPRELRAVR